MGLRLGNRRAERSSEQDARARSASKLRAPRAGFAKALGLGAVLLATGAAMAACYSTGDGTPPPLDRFYFPVGLQVSHGGNVLYATNSDFDLQYNGGTIQSYDLFRIRRDALQVIAWSKNGGDIPAEVPLVREGDRRLADPNARCATDPPLNRTNDTGERQSLGQTCAPPVFSNAYRRDTVLIGAFATDMVLTPKPSEPLATRRNFDRLFVPVRGNASLSWADVVRDDPNVAPAEGATLDAYPAFRIQCGRDANGRCDAFHSAGEDPSDNSRGLKMPGEPFGLALSEDARFAVITHQTETKTSLFSTGLTPDDAAQAESPRPTLQFVLDGVPYGGIGVAAIPHDAAAVPVTNPPTVYPSSFLQTSRAASQVTLLQSYPDDGTRRQGADGSSLLRPFLDLPASFPINVGTTATDSRGIAIDPSPRITCKERVNAAARASGLDRASDEEIMACARKPARVFIANRTPASLIVGDIGATNLDGSYDYDRLTFHSVIPLTAGPSNVYLAPIIDRDGTYALRVFAVCFDSDSIFVIDPDTLALESVIHVGEGPFALAFDPFVLEDVANHKVVDPVTTDPNPLFHVRPYRFAYLASFTKSFVQIIDLDNAQPDGLTFERVIFTLGEPTDPKGT